MFEVLGEAIEGLEIPLDGDALAAAYALRDRLDARLADATAAFDRQELWELDGATSLTAWLRSRAGMTGRRAAHAASTARRTQALPVTAEAWRAGELSSGQVESILGVLGRDRVVLFAEHERDLVPTLANLSAIDTERAMRVWKAYADAGGTPPDDVPGELHLSPSLDGSGVIDGTLSPEGYAVVKTALRLADTPDVDGEPARSPAQHRHDAFVDVCRHFLDHQQTRRGGRHRPHLNVIVDVEAIEAGRGGQVVNGPHLDGPTTARLLCDGVLHRVVMSGRSTILDYGTATRTTPVNLWNALVVRDGGCRWPGCDRPPEWCEAHHVQWASNGGPTRPDNEALLCSRHHHIAHLPGWTVHLDADGTLTVTDPAGRTRSTRPPGTLWPLAA
jgi:hypothetical protein